MTASSCFRLIGSFIIASYAACSCLLIANMGSSLTFAAVSLRVFAFCSAIKLSSEACFSSFLWSLPLIKVSMRLFPRRYPSISSVVPDCPFDGPWYIQSTLSTRFRLPAASSFCWISSFARSSFNSLIRSSVFLRSSSAFFSSSHTFF